MPKAPTVEDVALAAGVSRQTVSNVINTPGIVKEATRERVQRAIDDLGYRPHMAARRLRTRRSSTIGIHLDPYAGGISGVVLDRFVHALTERAGDRGMRIQLYAARSPDEEIARMGELTDGGEVDAVVITGTFHGDPRTRWLAERNVPFVAFGRPWGADDVESPAHLWVDVDGAAGTRAATQHVLEIAGPRVAFLGWPAGSGTGDDRERGWREAMAEAGATGERIACEESVGLARAATAVLLANGGAVDGIVCVSDSLAIGAHLAAAAAGRPDLPVVGFDNTPAAEAIGLSSVEQLPEQVASGVLQLLMGPSGSVVEPRLLAAGEAHVLVEPRLVVR
ncbi:LacI family DNA-binding transcriptional regulator [Microbacterium flavescens]|jgi:DNA-binding LacI/PurR family transcriptional regulator|uniref:LacI family DNA-binding transcriptional regulator n=1 Tax=Microbacterium flavescens TaxID=69366 RepID=UPI001BDDE847|nr:LacI family DNA-binding transcriptional regulator [Microbacterium flavescens]BFF12206.1 LacI family DNA-binding transcriptional regulator [Microbacterium flavescens]